MASPIEDIIEEIEEYIDSCKPVAFSSTKISVNRDDIQSLLEELRSKTPEEIRRYQKIINNEKAILDNAKKQADAILAKAQIKTDELVSEHQIMQQAYAQANEVVMVATKRAQELLDNATNDANDIRTSAIAYTDSLLMNLQEIIVRTMDSTRTKADTYLGELQGYLDRVVANRMELSPSPEETIANAPQPKVGRVQTPVVNKPAQQPKPSAADQASQKVERQATGKLTPASNKPSDKDKVDDKKDQGTDEAKGVRSMSEKFFNKD